MIEIKHFDNEEDNEITNSKDEVLNNDDLNNKVDVYFNYNSIKKPRKKELNYSKNNNNNLSLSTKINKEKKIIIRNYNNNQNLNKIQSNPFLIQNSLQRDAKRKKIFKISPKSSYRNKFINKENNNSLLKNAPIIGKSIFSKISENILKNDKNKKSNKKTKNLEQINEDNYNQLTEELYLHSKVNNPTNENNKIISEFLKRKKKEEISKKIGMENDNSKNMTQTLKDQKRSNNLTDRNRSYKSKRTFGEFLKDQKNKEEKHLYILKKNVILQKEKINLNLRDRPLLNEESIKIINKKVKDKMNIHLRLYQDFNEKKNREKEKEKEKLFYNKKNKEIKINRKKIEENSNRLFNEYKTKNDRNNEIKYKKLNSNKTMNFNSVSKNSNDIIFKKFINKIINAFNNLFGKKIEDEFYINYNEFLKLLYNIGFISNNYFELIYNNSNNNILEDKNNNKIKMYLDSEIAYKLSKEAWKLIIKNKEFANDIKGHSKNVIFFIINVLGFYNKEINNKNIKNILEKNKIEINPINLNLSSKIYKSFHLYRNCAINSLLSKETKNKNNNIQNENENIKQEKSSKSNNKTTKNKIINNKSYVNYNTELKKRQNNIKQIEAYKSIRDKKIFWMIPAPNQNREKDKTYNIGNTEKFLNSSFNHLNNNKDIYNNIKNNPVNNSFSSNNFRKMFLKNPLEKDNDIKKKINELKEARNKKKIDQIIRDKGIPINTIENNFNSFYEYNDYNERFVYTDEPLNNFKNTFKKFEKAFALQKIMKKEKYVFEIFVEKQPKKLIIYHGDDINLKIKDFCSKYNLDYNDKKQIINNINKQIESS